MARGVRGRKKNNEAVETVPVEVTESVKTKTEPRKVRKQIDRHALVPTMSYVVGGLVYISPMTKAEWRWNEFGDVQYIELGELQSMLSSRPKFIKEPFLLILDEDVIEYLNLTDFYKTIIKPDEFDELFDKDIETIKERLSKAPKGSKELAIYRARKLYEEGSLTVGKQRTIEEVTKASLATDV